MGVSGLRYIKPLLAAIAIAVLCSGCSFNLAASADDLIAPVLPEGENSEVQGALKNFCGNSFVLKAPLSGEYTTPYIFNDINSDGEEEAVVFYEVPGDSEIINMAVISKLSGEWEVAENITGEGSEVYSIEFVDFNNDGNVELVVLWNMISNSSNHVLTVYSQDYENGDYSVSRVGNTISLDDYACVDINGDGRTELIALVIDSANTSARAIMYKYHQNSGMQSEGYTKLDGHISAYSNVVVESNEDDVYIFADAVSSNMAQSLTEIIKYSDYYSTIISPFYSYATASTTDTVRTFVMNSTDVNGDGLVEIPLDADYSAGKYVKAVEWKNYNGNALNHSCYSLVLFDDAYQVFVPDSYIDDNMISVKYDSKNSIFAIRDMSGQNVLRVRRTLVTEYQQNVSDYDGYFELFNVSGYVYMAKCGNSKEIPLTDEEIMQMVSLIEK